MLKPLLITAAALVLLAGCSKKNDSPPQSTIVGRWQFNSDTTKDYVNGTLSDTEVAQFKPGGYAIFNSDGTGSESPQSDTVKFNYAIDDKNLTFNYPTQVVDGITIQAQTVNCTIKQLDSHHLLLFFDTTNLEGGNTERETEVSHLSR